MPVSALTNTSTVNSHFDQKKSFFALKNLVSTANPFILVVPKVSKTRFYYHRTEFNFNDKLLTRCNNKLTQFLQYSLYYI